MLFPDLFTPLELSCGAFKFLVYILSYYFYVVYLFEKSFYSFLDALSSLLCAGFLWLRQAGASPRCSAQASHCRGFSCCGAQALGAWSSVIAACGLSSCGTRASLLCGMWNLPGSGIEPICIGRWILIHCATREVHLFYYF